MHRDPEPSGAGDADPPAAADYEGHGVRLVEPARAQLIDIASEVLGRLSAEEVPTALRPLARFTAARRRRLGAPALAAALDADESFRASVARVVSESSPQLADAVRDGAPTDAAEPVDVAVLAYLLRPDGWQRTVAAANDRWTADRVGGADEAQIVRLREDLHAARALARGESARTREAVASAVAASETAAAELRRTVRDRTRELRAAERDRDAALARADEVRAELDSRTAAHEAEVRRLRGRLADAERAIEAAKRGLRSEREVDDARLYLLVDTLVRAAAGIRRELALPVPTRRPADAVGTGSPADGGARRADDVAALDRVLALPNVHVVVDGYNVTKTGYGDLSLADQRTRLIGALAALAAQSRAEVTIAFDGGARPPVQPAVPRGVRVLFSAADEIADDLIRRLVAAEPPGRPVVVVTSDQQVVADTGRDGAWSVPSAVLLARLA